MRALEQSARVGGAPRFPPPSMTRRPVGLTRSTEIFAMTTRTRIIAASLAGIALLGAGAALARGGHDQPDMTRSGAAEHATEMFKRMDVNGDGQIDAADREAMREQHFARLDTDGDGTISPDEFAAARGARGGPEGERGGMRGHRGEGHGEHGMRAMHHGFGVPGGPAMVAGVDTDQNGSISQTEFANAALSRFDKADTNNDGTVTSAERQAQRQGMRDRMQRMRDAAGMAGKTAPQPAD